MRCGVGRRRIGRRRRRAIGRFGPGSLSAEGGDGEDGAFSDEHLEDASCGASLASHKDGRFGLSPHGIAVARATWLGHMRDTAGSDSRRPGLPWPEACLRPWEANRRLVCVEPVKRIDRRPPRCVSCRPAHCGGFLWRNWQTRQTQNLLSARTCRFEAGRGRRRGPQALPRQSRFAWLRRPAKCSAAPDRIRGRERSWCNVDRPMQSVLADDEARCPGAGAPP